MKYNLLLLFLIINNVSSSSVSVIPSCNKYNCSPLNGRCVKGNKCICLKGYTTVFNKDLGNFECNYEQRAIVKMFLLEMIVGFGVGHFYIGDLRFGIAKLVYGSITFYVICQMSAKGQKTCWNVLQLILGLGWILWQIGDGFLIAFGIYKDDNGIPLRDWRNRY